MVRRVLARLETMQVGGGCNSTRKPIQVLQGGRYCVLVRVLFPDLGCSM